MSTILSKVPNQGLCPWTPLEDFRPPDSLIRPPIFTVNRRPWFPATSCRFRRLTEIGDDYSRHCGQGLGVGTSDQFCIFKKAVDAWHMFSVTLASLLIASLYIELSLLQQIV